MPSRRLNRLLRQKPPCKVLFPRQRLLELQLLRSQKQLLLQSRPSPLKLPPLKKLQSLRNGLPRRNLPHRRNLWHLENLLSQRSRQNPPSLRELHNRQ